VAIITGRVTHALSVPVTALLAQAGGGYAVETVDAGGERHLVPVDLGAFDDTNGLVQVRGSGLRAGQRVVVPAT
jgi:multidrug efflux pump subunit AcrA (membrane-fusion protein)